MHLSFEYLLMIKLIIQGVTDIPAVPDTSVILLTDEKSQRTISVVCSKFYNWQIAKRRDKYVGSELIRSMAMKSFSKSLPEVLVGLLTKNSLYDYRVVIKSVMDGDYQSIVEDILDPDIRFDIHTPDALLFSYASDGKIPVYIEDDLWYKQSTPYFGDNAPGISLPLNTLSVELLKDALDKCIAEEQYEAAKQIKDELDSRNKK